MIGEYRLSDFVKIFVNLSLYVRYMDIARDFSPEAIPCFYEIATPACRQARNDPLFVIARHPIGCRSNLIKDKIASSLTLLAMTDRWKPVASRRRCNLL